MGSILNIIIIVKFQKVIRLVANRNEPQFDQLPIYPTIISYIIEVDLDIKINFIFTMMALEFEFIVLCKLFKLLYYINLI